MAALDLLRIKNPVEFDNFHPELLNAFFFYSENQQNKNIYEALAEKYNFTEDEAFQFFLLIELERYISQSLHLSTRSNGISCGIAVAATIVHTLSAVTVVTPVGLGFWLAGKALATAGVIGSCS